MADAPRAAGRRAPRALLVLLAVVAVVLAIAIPLGLHLTGQGHTDGGLRPDPRAEMAQGWRVEAYAGVQLYVPDRFGWASSPSRSSTRWCGADGAAVAPHHQGVPDAATPYVGRPIPTSDVCRGYDPAHPTTPESDSVWFDSPLPVGSHRFDTDFVQRTRAVGGSHVTVTSRDKTLVDRVLGTARRVRTDDNGRATTPDPRLPAAGPDGTARSLSVCAYDGTTLVWSARRSGSDARSFERAFAKNSALFDAAKECTHDPAGRFVALGANRARTTRWYTAELGCGQLLEQYTSQDGPSLAAAGFTEATVAPWGGAELRAYVSGPGVPGVEKYFRGVQG